MPGRAPVTFTSSCRYDLLQKLSQSDQKQINKPMKEIPTLSPQFRKLFFGALLASSLAMTCSAQNWYEKFNTNSIWAQTNHTSLATWQWWGGCTTLREWTTNDAGNDPTSGSLHFVVTWPSPAGSGDFQYSIGVPLSGISPYSTAVLLNPVNYTNFEFDLMWDTNNSTADIADHMTGGDPNGFGFGFVATQYGQSWAPNP